MNFGPGEMAQMMDSAKALITVTIVSGIGIGIVLGAIVAVYRIFFGTAPPTDRSNPKCRSFLPCRSILLWRPFLPWWLMQLRRLASDHRSGAQTT